MYENKETSYKYGTKSWNVFYQPSSREFPYIGCAAACTFSLRFRNLLTIVTSVCIGEAAKVLSNL